MMIAAAAVAVVPIAVTSHLANSRAIHITKIIQDVVIVTVAKTTITMIIGTATVEIGLTNIPNSDVLTRIKIGITETEKNTTIMERYVKYQIEKSLVYS